MHACINLATEPPQGLIEWRLRRLRLLSTPLPERSATARPRVRRRRRQRPPLPALRLRRGSHLLPAHA
jgi:hypothetical protein